MDSTSKRDLAHGKPKGNIGGVRVFINCLGAGLAIASIIQELRKPARRRTWHGALFGRIPYDWRVPTAERIRRTFWEPKSRRVVQPTVFGVGWSVNFAAMLGALRR